MSRRKVALFVVLALMGTATLIGMGLHSPASRPPAAPPVVSSPAVLLPVQNRLPKNLAAGRLLVATRELADPHFAKTVILLVHYDEKGVLGLILNRRTEIPLSHAFEDLKAFKGRSDPVYLGGPVGTPSAFALLKSPNNVEGAEHVFGGVYLIAAKPVFEKTILARPDPHVFHVYLGYAGWTSEQLDMEVELGSWFIFPGDTAAVFNSDPDTLWESMIQKTEMKMAKVNTPKLLSLVPPS